MIDIAKLAASIKASEAKLAAPMSDADKTAVKKHLDTFTAALVQRALPAIKKAEDARNKWLKAYEVVNTEINRAADALKPVKANQKAVIDLVGKLEQSYRTKKADKVVANLVDIKVAATGLDLTEELLQRANPKMSQFGDWRD